MATAEIVSAAAAVVSAIGGTFAALAAFRSAESARVTQQAAAAAEHRAALREIGLAAAEVLVEAQRVSIRGGDLKLAYRTLFVYSGRSGSPSQTHYDTAIEEKLKHTSELSDYARLFVSASEKLNGVAPEETDRVKVRLSSALMEIRALREDLEREFSGVEGQSATYRDKAIKGAM